MTQHERINLKLQWHQARMASLVAAGWKQDEASRIAYDAVRQLTDEDLLEWDARQRAETEGDGPAARV